MESTQNDLPQLAMALEYADLAAALYLAGGSDHAARLLAAGAEQVLGDLARLLGPRAEDDKVQTLLARIALRYKAPLIEPRGTRQSQWAVTGHGDLDDGGAGSHAGEGEVRNATRAYLRACWYTLESMGLEAVIPIRLQQAVESSTILMPAES